MAVYLRPCTTNSSFNSGDYNYQDTKMSIKSAEVAYAKIDDHNLDIIYFEFCLYYIVI